MTTRIEDSPRAHLAKWIAEAVRSGDSQGAIVTPWATPSTHVGGAGKKPGLIQRAGELAADGVTVWFDPMTHALQIPAVGDFRYYSQYDLWGGPSGDLSSESYVQEHVARVFLVQDQISAPHLAPTVLLHTGLSPASVTALELSREAVRLDSHAMLTIAGTPSFWMSGSALDAHVGALLSLKPGGWNLSVVRPDTGVPVATSPEEVHGVCRTARALSDHATVHMSHGDLAGLPAVAAGAATLGTGWDQRQRVCATADYAARAQKAGGGGWFLRPTLRTLLGCVSDNEAIVLTSRDPGLATRLGGIPPSGPREVFDHHVHLLAEVIRDIASRASYEDRYRRLVELYEDASRGWVSVDRAASPSTSAKQWVDPHLAGLMLYGATEGW